MVYLLLQMWKILIKSSHLFVLSLQVVQAARARTKQTHATKTGSESMWVNNILGTSGFLVTKKDRQTAHLDLVCFPLRDEQTSTWHCPAPTTDISLWAWSLPESTKQSTKLVCCQSQNEKQFQCERWRSYHHEKKTICYFLSRTERSQNTESENLSLTSPDIHFRLVGFVTKPETCTNDEQPRVLSSSPQAKLTWR